MISPVLRTFCIDPHLTDEQSAGKPVEVHWAAMHHKWCKQRAAAAQTRSSEEAFMQACTQCAYQFLHDSGASAPMQQYRQSLIF